MSQLDCNVDRLKFWKSLPRRNKFTAFLIHSMTLNDKISFRGNFFMTAPVLSYLFLIKSFYLYAKHTESIQLFQFCWSPYNLTKESLLSISYNVPCNVRNQIHSLLQSKSKTICCSIHTQYSVILRVKYILLSFILTAWLYLNCILHNLRSI